MPVKALPTVSTMPKVQGEGVKLKIVYARNSFAARGLMSWAGKLGVGGIISDDPIIKNYIAVVYAKPTFFQECNSSRLQQSDYVAQLLVPRTVSQDKFEKLREAGASLRIETIWENPELQTAGVANAAFPITPPVQASAPTSAPTSAPAKKVPINNSLLIGIAAVGVIAAFALGGKKSSVLKK